MDAISGAAGIVAGIPVFLMDQDPLNVEAIWERIRTSGIFGGAQAGQFVTALTAVEIALWDLAGKAVGLPIYQLMGGKVRDRIRVYIDSGTDSRDDPQCQALHRPDRGERLDHGQDRRRRRARSGALRSRQLDRQ